ncbi:hypothetical protein HK102_007197 [Quaeritorhiza haematococci]|nr:hypothetical protein HK102_007197 [Quaeritorhiza haematococci]
MSIRKSAILALLLIITVFGAARVSSLPTPETSQPNATERIDSAILVMGREYKRLRSIKGFFDGGDEIIADVDSYGGRKHQIMLSLQNSLVVPGSPSQRMVDIMGVPDVLGLPPDVKIDEEEESNAGISKIAGDFWIYKWRGLRDFMWVYVNAMDESVVASGWFITHRA